MLAITQQQQQDAHAFHLSLVVFLLETNRAQIKENI
jgi:hypothetical protein